jgi:hypothetical protein
VDASKQGFAMSPGKLIAAATVLASLAAAHAASWQPFRSDADGFSVDFSGKVKTDTSNKPGAGRQTTYAQSGAGFAYMVIVQETSDGASTYLDKAAAAYGLAFGCKKISSFPVSGAGFNKVLKVQGSECGKDGAHVLVAKSFAKGERSHEALYFIGPAASKDDADHFLTSFKPD